MRFERVTFTAFANDMRKYAPVNMTNEKMFEAWTDILLPERATKYSAGYDVRCPIAVTIPAGEHRVIPTGIRAVFNEDEMESWHMQLYVRSSVGIKQGIVLSNSTGVIDADYFKGLNEGDFLLALHNTSDVPVTFKAGDRVCQAVFLLHGLTENDKAEGDRKGGVGSTSMG